MPKLEMQTIDVTDVVKLTFDIKQANIKMWRDGKSDMYWLARLTEEVGELSSALLGRHEHPPEVELRQIAAICLNWLEYRACR